MQEELLRQSLAQSPKGMRKAWRGFQEKYLGKTRPLQHIQVEVTSHCPGACCYCPHSLHAGSWRARHMSAEVFVALRPLFRQSTRVHLQGWGEPLLHPYFQELVAIARADGCQVSTTSCGLHMTEQLALGLVQSGMDVIGFSLCGTDEQSNQARRKVPFAKVQAAIACLNQAKKEVRKSSLEIHFAYLLLADNMEAFCHMPELMQAWDVPVCVVSTLDMPVLAEHWALAIRPEEQEKVAKAKTILEQAAQQAARLGRSIRYALPRAKTMHGCREDIERSCYVDADGDVSPCIYVNVPCAQPSVTGKAFVYGNVLEEEAWQIWQKPAFKDFRADLMHDVAPKPCQSCPKRFESFSA